MDSITLQVGDIEITPIIEIEGGDLIQKIIPNATPENIAKISWLKPFFADEKNNLKALVQSFVIETAGERIVVDTCIGNNRVRPQTQKWSNLKTDFLSHFEKQFKRETINKVICTHLHFDHVGWNTMLGNDRWIPTFPNARYLFVENEFNYWKDFPKEEIEDDFAGFREAVLPVLNAGLVDLVAADHKISDEISLIPTHGHTPSHVSILIKSKGRKAVITGDVFHHPCQIAYPDWKSFDTNSKQALASRLALLERFADTETLIIGSHFASPTGGILQRYKDSFKLSLNY